MKIVFNAHVYSSMNLGSTGWYKRTLQNNKLFLPRNSYKYSLPGACSVSPLCFKRKFPFQHNTHTHSKVGNVVRFSNANFIYFWLLMMYISLHGFFPSHFTSPALINLHFSFQSQAEQ